MAEMVTTVRELIGELQKVNPEKEVVFLAGPSQGIFVFCGIRDCLNDNMVFFDIEDISVQIRRQTELDSDRPC
jgi:hypothetical protein